MGIFSKGIRETQKINETSGSRMTELKTSAENACVKTKENFIKEHGTPEQIGAPRFRSEIHANNLEVLDNSAYKSRFPSQPSTILGNHSVEDGRSYLRANEGRIVRHVAVHETEHDLTYRELRKSGNVTIVLSGLRECRYEESQAGKIRVFEDRGRALNEGYTQLLTERELKRQGDTEALYSIRPYSETKRQAAQLETIVGKEKMERAYYLGEKNELTQEFNRLNNSEAAWDCFCDDVDICANNPPSSLRAAAGARINETFSTMREAKTKEMG